MQAVTRAFTVAAFAAIAALIVFAGIDRQRLGTPAVTLVAENAASNNRFVVRRAPPRSPLHPGDLVAIGDPGDLAAFLFHALAAGSTLRLERIAPPPAVSVDEPVVATAPSPFAQGVILVACAFLLVAGVIAIKGRANGALSLAWSLAIVVLIVNPTTPGWPRAGIIACAILNGVPIVLAFFCATEFATRFAGDPHAAWARRVRAAGFVLAAVALCSSVGLGIDEFLHPSTPLAWSTVAVVTSAAQALLLLTALGCAFAKASAFERDRITWTAASIGVGFAGLACTVIAGFSGVAEPARDYPLLLLVAMPLGCAYAILRYRLLDIAFVVNRATVFGITSLVVLCALALVDFGLQALLGSYMLRTGLAVQLGLAVAIGIATRPIHAWVDRTVDDVFFRRRHEAERALRAFARDLAWIDDANVVMQRTVDVVARHLDARCTLFLATPSGFEPVASAGGASPPAPLDRNDPAVVRLRATGDAVDLHDLSTALRADYAFPLFGRNRLLGILACASSDGRALLAAPDERESVTAVARACGVALDVLRIERLEKELDALRAGARIEAVPLPPL